jgi:hypothetical protein
MLFIQIRLFEKCPRDQYPFAFKQVAVVSIQVPDTPAFLIKKKIFDVSLGTVSRFN